MVTILKCWSQKPSESEQFFYRKHLYSLQGLQRTQCLHFFIEYVHCREEGYIGLYNVHPYRPKDFPRPDNQQLKLYLMKIWVGSKCFSITQSSSKSNSIQALSVRSLFTDVRDYSANYRMRNWHSGCARCNLSNFGTFDIFDTFNPFCNLGNFYYYETFDTFESFWHIWQRVKLEIRWWTGRMTVKVEQRWRPFTTYEPSSWPRWPRWPNWPRWASHPQVLPWFYLGQ